MKEIVTLSRRVERKSETGVLKDIFEPYAVVRAEVVAQNSKRAMMRGEELYPTTRVFKMRTPPLVEGGDRIIHRGVTYVALAPVISTYERMQTVTAEQLNE